VRLLLWPAAGSASAATTQTYLSREPG